MRQSNLAENWKEVYSPFIYTESAISELPEQTITSLEADKNNFFYNPELYLELALQDIEYQYSAPEEYIFTIARWVKPLPARTSARRIIQEIANAFLHRNLSSTSRSFAFSLYELATRNEPSLAERMS